MCCKTAAERAALSLGSLWEPPYCLLSATHHFSQVRVWRHRSSTEMSRYQSFQVEAKLAWWFFFTDTAKHVLRVLEIMWCVCVCVLKIAEQTPRIHATSILWQTQHWNWTKSHLDDYWLYTIYVSFFCGHFKTPSVDFEKRVHFALYHFNHELRQQCCRWIIICSPYINLTLFIQASSI